MKIILDLDDAVGTSYAEQNGWRAEIPSDENPDLLVANPQDAADFLTNALLAAADAGAEARDTEVAMQAYRETRAAAKAGVVREVK